MNERFVAVSTVTGSRIRGCFSEPRCDLSVTRGGNRPWMQLDWAICSSVEQYYSGTASCAQLVCSLNEVDVRHDWSTDVGISTTSRCFCMISTGWRCQWESPTSWLWLSVGAYMAWHRRICAMICNVSQNWIGAGCIHQCPTPLLFQQPDSLRSVTVPFWSPTVAYGTVCQLTSRPQKLCLSSVLV